MRPRTFALYLVPCAIAVAIGIAVGQETKSTAEVVPGRPVLDPALIWNFHFQGTKRAGDFLEFLTPEEGRQRTLVITQIDLRLPQSTRAQVVEHRPVRQQGKEGWKKIVRRSDPFSLGTLDSATRAVMSTFVGLPGMKFDGGTRPSLEITEGSGEIAVYAEGYWSAP